MTPEQQRIKIAEACGWRFNKISKFICGETFEVVSPDLKRSYGWSETYKTIHSRSGVDVAEFAYQTIEQVLKHASIPDFLNDLNAMHEAEEILTDNQRMHFRGELVEMMRPKYGFESACLMAIHATAAQRAEAFLKTLNLWKE